ncbi:hypothetical protein [Demequina sp.]|uniref:hypothetical protein n=1 Tax=Demequina sp. TaxID=2050685 RepID=UPI003A8561A8
MTRPTPVPSAFEVRDLFEGMLGRDVTWESRGGPVDVLDGAAVAAYVDDLGRLAALALADIPLVARAGSAIGLMAPATALSAIAEGLVTPMQFDNLSEILNVAASLLNKADTPHLRLRETYAPREALPADVRDLALVQGGRIDGTLDIQGYGPGRLSIVVDL